MRNDHTTLVYKKQFIKQHSLQSQHCPNFSEALTLCLFVSKSPWPGVCFTMGSSHGSFQTKDGDFFYLRTRGFHIWMAGQGPKLPAFQKLVSSCQGYTTVSFYSDPHRPCPLRTSCEACSLIDSSDWASSEGFYSLEGRSQNPGSPHGSVGLGEQVMDSAARQAQDASLPLPQSSSR